MTTTILGTPLNLPCGATLPNRLAKAAMSEGLAGADNHATPRLEALYTRWANSGAGLLFTGNIQVDRLHLERPSNVVLELSGGSLEQPKVVGISVKDEGEDRLPESTIKREAYFVEFAGAVRAVARMPVMVTGGFRTASGMVGALEGEELDLIGIGRPLIADPSIPRRLIAGEVEKAPTPEATLEIFHLMPWFSMQIERMGDGLEADLTLSGQAAAEQFVLLETAYLARLLERRGLLQARGLA